jgi:hypothetical protein
VKKNILVLLTFLVLMTRHVGAVESESSFGIGIGALYSGIGVNVGFRSERDFKYVAAGCAGIGYSDNSGWLLPCGIGAGWIWTDLLSKDDKRNGFGLYVKPVGIDNSNDDKARYGLGVTYAFFLQGLCAGGWNMGITPTLGKEHGDTKVGLFMNVGYQF